MIFVSDMDSAIGIDSPAPLIGSSTTSFFRETHKAKIESLCLTPTMIPINAAMLIPAPCELLLMRLNPFGKSLFFFHQHDPPKTPTVDIDVRTRYNQIIKINVRKSQ